VHEGIEQARRHVDALKLALESLSQEEIGNCLPRLDEAVACLQAIEQELNKRPRRAPDIGRQLLSLGNELDIAQRLVIHGSAFCESWGRMLGVAAGGYGATGEAAPLAAPGSVSVEG
jgi:hypothetical protein